MKKLTRLALLFAVLLTLGAVQSQHPVIVAATQIRRDEDNRTLTFADRVTYQRAIEEVYWQHRIWPKANAGPKPPLEKENRVKPTTVAWRTEPLQLKGARAGTMAAVTANYTLPTISSDLPDVCTDDTWTPTNLANAPLGRSLHTAVWTGSEMIVWGGYDGFDPFNTGGRYNTSNDSWTATTTINAPFAPVGHTAVWTGIQMIVWGGQGVGNTGGRYSPNTDSWTVTSTTNAPTGRGGHTAVWTGSEMIVWGGYQFGGSDTNTAGRYNTNTDSAAATSTTK